MKSRYGLRLGKGASLWMIDALTGRVFTLEGEIHGPAKSRARRLRRARQAGARQIGPYTYLFAVSAGHSH